MTTKTSIYCSSCGAFIGNAEDFSHMVIPAEGIKCPDCGTVVIASNDPIF